MLSRDQWDRRTDGRASSSSGLPKVQQADGTETNHTQGGRVPGTEKLCLRRVFGSLNDRGRSTRVRFKTRPIAENELIVEGQDAEGSPPIICCGAQSAYVVPPNRVVGNRPLSRVKGIRKLGRR